MRNSDWSSDVCSYDLINKVEYLNSIVSQEYDSSNNSLIKYQGLEYQSQLNIPFTHTYYARFDQQMNALGTNSHTASKPFMYDDVAPYYDFVDIGRDQCGERVCMYV